MDFALNPDDGGRPRIVRFTNLGPNVVWEYHKELNLLLVDTKRFEALDSTQQHRVLRTREAMGVQEQQAA